MELRNRIYPVQVHDYCEHCAVYLEPVDPAQKIPGFNYATREEMDALQGYIESDEIERTWTKDKIMASIGLFTRLQDVKDYFKNRHDKSLATIKFFGEMMFQGHTFQSHNKDTGESATDYAYQCSNPACKFEKVTQKQYPFVQNVEGKLARTPQELTTEDKIIAEKMRNHVGSSVVPDATVKTEEK